MRDRVRGRLRRRVRLRVDRRVAPRRARHRRLGLRADDARSRARSPPWRAVQEALAEVPVPDRRRRGRASPSSCAPTTARAPSRECLEALLRLDYPDYEVIVVDDGSTDATARDRERVTTCGSSARTNRGLSSARNTGLARRHRRDRRLHRRRRVSRPALAHVPGARRSRRPTTSASAGRTCRRRTTADRRRVRRAAPRAARFTCCSPTREAEHIPGCNMAFRRRALRGDRRLRPASSGPPATTSTCAGGCRSAGWTLGFSPAAVVWHHRRNSVRAYWRQQRGYGRAEALLERKWPEKLQRRRPLPLGGPRLRRGLTRDLVRRAAHLSRHVGHRPLPVPSTSPRRDAAPLPLMPEWFLVIAVLVGLAIVGAGGRLRSSGCAGRARSDRRSPGGPAGIGERGPRLVPRRAPAVATSCSDGAC